MNVNVDLVDVLSKAGQIIWKFKRLWFLGFLVSIGSWLSGLPYYFLQMFPGYMGDLSATQATRITMLGVVFLFLIVLSILFIYTSVIAEISTIKWVQHALFGTENLSLSQLWDESHNYFWRMLVLKSFVGIPAFIPTLVYLMSSFVLSTAKMNESTIGLSSVLFGLSTSGMFCFSIVLFVVNAIFIQIENSMVIEDIGIFESLSSGWMLFKKNLVTILLVAILLAILGYLAGLFGSIPVAMSIPFIFVLNRNISSYLIPALCLTIVLPIAMVINGLANAYSQAVFTITYLRLTVPIPEPPAPIFDAQ